MRENGVDHVVESLIEGDPGARGVQMNEVDEFFEERKELFVLADAGAEEDAVPRVGGEGGDESWCVVGAVQPDQAVLGVDAKLAEAGSGGFDGVDDRRRVPGARDAVGIETDDENLA